MKKILIYGFVLLMLVSSVLAMINITGETVRGYDDVFNFTEDFNVTTGNLSMVNVTLLNDTFSNYGVGKVIQAWYVLFNITNNYSYSVENTTIIINDSEGYVETGVTDQYGKYNTNLSERYWQDLNVTNTTPYAFVLSDGVDTQSENGTVTNNTVFNFTVSWGLLMFSIILPAFLILFLLRFNDIVDNPIFKTGFLMVTPFIILIGVAVFQNFAVWNAAPTPVLNALGLIFQVVLWIGIFTIGYSLVTFTTKSLAWRTK